MGNVNGCTCKKIMNENEPINYEIEYDHTLMYGPERTAHGYYISREELKSRLERHLNTEIEDTYRVTPSGKCDFFKIKGVYNREELDEAAFIPN